MCATAAAAPPADPSVLELLRLLRLSEEVDLDALQKENFRRNEEILKKARDEMQKIVAQNRDQAKGKFSEIGQAFTSINFLAQAQETRDTLSQDIQSLEKSQADLGKGHAALRAQTSQEIASAENLIGTLGSLQETLKADAQRHSLQGAVEAAGNLAVRSVQNRNS